MNITETKIKRTKSYRSDTRHGGDQQGYNRNPWQGDSNNGIIFKQKTNNHQNNDSEEIKDN